jgi:hypothetical protein
MNDFKWAYGREANVKEPITALKEKGWQYADVPTASNFNWLFNKIQKELDAVNSVLFEFKESVNAELKTIKDNINAELKNIKDAAVAIKTTANDALAQSKTNERNIDFATGVSRQICSHLRMMEENIKRYHKDFPGQAWPIKDKASSLAEETDIK